jgi:hypothetical protein
MTRRPLTITALLLTLGTTAQTSISLNSDNTRWTLRPQSDVGADSIRIYRSDYDAHDWVTAIVPGIVFNAYVVAGIEKDPNYADNIYRVDKSKYDRNFWYRTTFATPAQSSPAPGAPTRTWLHFRGVNRKGEVFFNGIRLGLLDGFMQRGDYDVTDLLSKSGPNVLAVLVHWPGRPIPNHASPTYISSDGWDWMPPVPGLLQGITDEVYLTVQGDARIVDPWIQTTIPNRNEGDVSLKMEIEGQKEQKAQVTATIEPGSVVLIREVKLHPGQNQDISFTTKIENPKLWWPNGYGEPNLYTCIIKVTIDGQVADSRQVKFGIRQYTYDTAGGVFHIKVNGEKIFVRGGSWGMSEYLLRTRGKEYDLKVRLHQEMHYNMIRNWIGSTTDEAFYDACDKYGIMVWDDFWLNSHPNLPDDVFAFNANAVEKIKRLRNHPSVAVWCGDNEGTPLPPLNGWLREDVQAFDGGDRWYQPNSHTGALTGSGPWTSFPPSWYFTRYPGGFGGSPGWGFRTEIGTAVFTTFESFKKFMPDSTWWPKNRMWDRHFFGPSAGNAGPNTYMTTVERSWGSPTGIEDFCRKAQLVNIETNKALYEGWQHHMWDDASGVMTWMSQSAYPSMVWQTYDYYYDLTGAYWGVRKACEPIHIQWSYADNSVKVINTTLRDLRQVQARAIIYDMQGKEVPGLGKTVKIDAPSDSATPCFTIGFEAPNPAGHSLVNFIRLLLTDENGTLLSDNFYWRSSRLNDYTALNTLPPVTLKVSSRLVRKGDRDVIEAVVVNPSRAVAFAIHVQAVKTSDGERILPALQSDDYFTLLRGETRTIDIDFDPALLPDNHYKLIVAPYNRH